jgi:hypothetical protein
MAHLFDALCDLAELALGCNSCKSRPPETTALKLPRMGGLVYLYGDRVAIHVGVLASDAGCRFLTGRLLGKSDPLDLSAPVIRGAMCELAYLLGGGVRRRLHGSGVISVGQPCFLEGTVQPRVGWRTQSIEVELDGNAATLVSLVRTDAASAFA